MMQMSDAGCDAVAVGLPNYLNDLPILVEEVLPRLASEGYRTTVS